MFHLNNKHQTFGIFSIVVVLFWLLVAINNVEKSTSSFLTTTISRQPITRHDGFFEDGKSRHKNYLNRAFRNKKKVLGLAAISTPVSSSSSLPKESNMKLSPNGVPVLGNIALQPEYSGLPGEIQGLIFKSLGAYANSGAFGYVIGAVSAMTKPRIRQVLGLRGIHGAGFKQGKMWGEFCATFTFMENAVRILRKGEQDKWNSIAGGALSGLYMSRDKPPQVMLQTAATYGGINYLFQSFAPQQSNDDQEEDGQSAGMKKKSNDRLGDHRKTSSKESGTKRKRLVIRYE